MRRGQQPSTSSLPSLPPPSPAAAISPDHPTTSQEVVVIAAKNAALGVAKDLRAKQSEKGRARPAGLVEGARGLGGAGDEL